MYPFIICNKYSLRSSKKLTENNKYIKEIGIQSKTEAYIQSMVLKKIPESISFEIRRGSEELEILRKRIMKGSTGQPLLKDNDKRKITH